MYKAFNFIMLILFYLLSAAQGKVHSPFTGNKTDNWVDSVLNSLSIDEKIGQLIMINAYSGKQSGHFEQTERMVMEYKIGGVVLIEGGPVRNLNMVDHLQLVSKTPLFVAVDAGNGMSVPLDSCIRYPGCLAICANENDSLMFEMGANIGKQCKRMGIQIFIMSPADLNKSLLNPVTGIRTYDNTPGKLFQKVVQVESGLKSQQVQTLLKHFPVHGDIQKDHQGLFNTKCRFEWLLMTDSLSREGADKPEDFSAEVKALIEGNDLLTFVTNPSKTIEAVKRAILSKDISVDAIDLRCRKVLELKRLAGLNKTVIVKRENLYTDLNPSAYRMTLRNIVQQSVTVIRNEDQLVPLQRLDTLKIATLSFGDGNVTEFQNSLERYTQTDNLFISEDADDEAIKELLYKLGKYNLVIAIVNNHGSSSSSDYCISFTQRQVIQQVISKYKTIVVIFGNPYMINYFGRIDKAHGLIVAYQDSNEFQDLSGQLLFGAFGSLGKLPVTINGDYSSGYGIVTSAGGRFKYTLPEELGVDSTYLKRRIDSLVNIGLKQKAFPGCSVFIARNGKVIFRESYGYQTYSRDRPLFQDDLFDFASLTKILAPIPALIRLYDQKKFFVNKRMSDYWPDWKGSNKQDIIVADVLSHQARLKTGIQFWMKTVDSNGNFKPGYYANDSTDHFGLRVSNHLYLINSFQDSVYACIRNSKLIKRKRYVYSDLGFIIFPRIIEELAHEDYESYLKQKFYHPLGAFSLTYRPYLYQPVEKIDPTEYDGVFRREQLQGFVHDESAAVLGGISGNAGLFGTINDAAKIMQMYLNWGIYGGERYLSESSMKEWTKRHFQKAGNRRGYGFDKPTPANYSGKTGDFYPAPLCSDLSFGHSGFTGTFAWADPGTGILFLFFSNRVYPSRTNSQLTRLKLRESIQQMAYEILRNGKFGW